MLLQCFLQFGGVYISFERDFQLRLFGFVYGTVQSYSFTPLNVSFGSIEMRISRNDISLVHQVGKQYVFGGTSLVCRDDVIKAGQPGNNFLQFEEGRGSGITFIAQHHACPLTVAHGSSARIGDKVDINLF